MDQRPARSLRFAGSLTMVAVVGSLLVMGAPASQAVNVAQRQIVNPNPANWTPNVLNGQVYSFVQIGNEGLRRWPVHAGAGRERRHDLLALQPLLVRRDDRRDRHRIRSRRSTTR